LKAQKNLSAIEVIADDALAVFKDAHQKELKKLLDTSTNLDNEDIDQMMTLSIPGIDEVMSFKPSLILLKKVSLKNMLSTQHPPVMPCG